MIRSPFLRTLGAKTLLELYWLIDGFKSSRVISRIRVYERQMLKNIFIRFFDLTVA